MEGLPGVTRDSQGAFLTASPATFLGSNPKGAVWGYCPRVLLPATLPAAGCLYVLARPLLATLCHPNCVIPEYNSAWSPSRLALRALLCTTPSPSDHGNRRGSHRWMACVLSGSVKAPPLKTGVPLHRGPDPKAPPPPSGSSLRRPPGLQAPGGFPGSLGQVHGPLHQQECRPEPWARLWGPGRLPPASRGSG